MTSAHFRLLAVTLVPFSGCFRFHDILMTVILTSWLSSPWHSWHLSNSYLGFLAIIITTFMTSSWQPPWPPVRHSRWCPTPEPEAVCGWTAPQSNDQWAGRLAGCTCGGGGGGGGATCLFTRLDSSLVNKQVGGYSTNTVVIKDDLPPLPEFVYTTKLFLKRCVSAASVKCPYDKIDEVDTMFLNRCVSAPVVELHWGGSPTNRASMSSFC